ncbi:NlpC/P60 family protein [Paenibacillus donghaensis]|uniref:NlpC/P60 domain-containing protein n=1 Tax=Paenibacillus donghaensis TaxID=414771 RepID=A0A2Z2K844_9BACL|nr:NlpC/P60 family protein [Paenibacillus donghaensis]ASA22766.1 hypothetical protein B9T62_19355 [Paenibacillus donghaensis]
MNALKTIYSRLTTMSKSESTLAAVGIKMRELNGEVKDAPVILDELASKWGSLSKEQQQNTAVNLAGRFQLSRFLALMQNYQISVNATETALHSQGSAVSENEKYMQSLEARIQKMKTAWDTLALAMGNAIISDSVVVITSLLTSLGNVLASTVEHFGLLPVLFGVSYAGLMLLSTGFRIFIVNITTTIASLFGMTAAASGARMGLMGLSASAKLAGISLKSMLISTGVGAALVGLGWILEKVIGHFAKTSEVVDEAGSSLDQLKEKTGNLKELQDLSNEYNELANKTNLTTQEKIRLAGVESDLASKHGVTMKTVEDQTDAVQANTAAIGDRIDKLKEEAAIEQQRALDEYKANKTQINSDIQTQESARKTAQAKLDELIKQQKYIEDSVANKTVIKNDAGQLPYTQNALLEIDPNDAKNTKRAIADLSEDIAQAIIDARKTLETAGTELDKVVSKREQAFKAQFSAYADTIEAGGTEVKASTRVLADGFASIVATAKTDDLEVLNKFKTELFNTFQKTDVNSMDDAVASLEKVAGAAGLTKDQYNILQVAISQLNFQGVNDGVEGVGDTAEDSKDEIISLTDAMKALDDTMNGTSDEMTAFVKSISDSSDEIELLTSAQNELKKSNNLSTSTITKMNEKYGDFIKVTGLSKDKVLEFIKSKKDEKIAVVNAEIAMTKQAIDGAKKRIEAMEIEVAAINKKRKALAQERIDSLNAGVSDGTISESLAEKQVAAILRNGDDTVLDLSIEKSGLDALSAKLSILNSVKEDFVTVANKTEKSTKDSTKANNTNYDSVSNTVEILTDLQKELLAVDVAQKKLQNSQDKLKDGSKERQESISKEISLLKEQKRLYEEGIKDPSKLVSTKVTTTVKTKASDSDSTASTSAIANMVDAARSLQGNFTYGQVGGKFKGTYDQFVDGAVSDCSQFIQEMFDEFLDVKVPRTAAEQAKQGVAVSKADLKAGDLVFFNTTGKANSHVGMYTGNGKFIQMGNKGLSEQDLNSKTWTQKYKYEGARRVASDSSYTPLSSSSDGKSTSKVGGKTVKTDNATAKEKADAKTEAEDKLVALDSQIHTAYIKSLDNTKTGFEQLIADQESAIEASKKKQDTLDPNSAEWRNENNKQINSQSKIQSIKSDEKNQLQYMMDALGVQFADYDAYLKKLSSDWLDVQAEKLFKVYANITSSIDSSKQRISDLGNVIDSSKNKMSQLEEGSSDYNKELNIQIATTKKQKTVNDELIVSTEKQLTNQKLNAKQKSDLNKILDEAKLEDYTAKIKDLNAELINSKSYPLENELSELNHQLDLSEAKMKGYVEGSEEYNQAIKDQVSILSDKISVTKKLIDYEETQSRNEELTASAREEHRNKLREYTLSLYEYSDAVKSLREDYADKIIENYKKLLQEQQKIQKDAYEKEKELENERHETRINNLESEYQAFENNINAQSKSLDREVSEDDYKKQLAILQKEKAELDAKFSSKLLDDSLEAKAQRVDIQKEIDAKAEEITKLQRDREITIRKDGLSDQLEDRKNAVDKEKKLEDDKNKSFIRNIDSLIKINDDYYNGLLNDEQYFYNMKQSLMSGDTVRIQNELGIVQAAYTNFYQELEKNSKLYADKISSNLKYAMSVDEKYAQNYPLADKSNNDTGTGSGIESGNGNTNPVTGGRSEKQTAWDSYLSNKQKAEQLKADMRTLIKNSADYKNKQAQFESLNSTNVGYRTKYGFPDGSYEELKNKVFSAKMGGMTPAGMPDEGQFLLAHEKELVLDKFDTSKLLKIINISRDVFSSLGNNIANILPQGIFNNNVKTPQAIDNSLSIRIDNIKGDKEGAKIVTDSIEELWNKKTKQGW